MSRICYCQASSCCATFQLVTDGYLRIILSNDLFPNPGPVQCPCSVCARAVATSHRAIQCDVCKKWCHIGPKCGNVPPRIYHELINKEYFNWNCPVCKDYHLRYDHERTVDQHSNGPSPDAAAGARPQSQCTSQHWDQDETPADEQVHSTLLKELGNAAHKDLKIAHLNVAGLLSKISEIRLLLSVVKFDILAVTESHLAQDVTSGETAVKGYNIARKDRKSGEGASGGTLIYFSENLNAYERDNLKVSTELEVCWVDITVNSQKLLIGCLYRPPGTNVNK